MKRLFAVMTLSAIILVGCGSPKYIDGKYYPTCGIIDQEECKDPSIRYSASPGNIFWGVVLFETIVAPIYFFGFSMFNPVAKK